MKICPKVSYVELTSQDVGKRVFFNAGKCVGEILEYLPKRNAYAIRESKREVSIFDFKGRCTAVPRFKVVGFVN